MSSHLVGLSEIAAMAGVSRQAVWNWTAYKHMGFPEPEALLSQGPVWKESVIRQWLIDKGKIQG